MKQITQFPVGATHVVIGYGTHTTVSYGSRQLKGKKVFETLPGQWVMLMPWVAKRNPGDPSCYWPIESFHTNEQDARLAVRANKTKAKNEGKKIVRIHKYNEQKVLG